jgi:hypothetical protein
MPATCDRQQQLDTGSLEKQTARMRMRTSAGRRLSFVPVGIIVALALLPAGALASAGDGASAHRAGGPVSASGAILSDGFLSPDKRIWCQADTREAGCVAYRAAVSSTPAHGGIVKRGGRVVLCPERPAKTAYSEWDCFQNFDEKAPVLQYGQREETAGFRCTSARKGITCTIVATGKGFLINRDEVLSVR